MVSKYKYEEIPTVGRYHNYISGKLATLSPFLSCLLLSQKRCGNNKYSDETSRRRSKPSLDARRAERADTHKREMEWWVLGCLAYINIKYINKSFFQLRPGPTFQKKKISIFVFSTSLVQLHENWENKGQGSQFSKSIKKRPASWRNFSLFIFSLHSNVSSNLICIMSNQFKKMPSVKGMNLFL